MEAPESCRCGNCFSCGFEATSEDVKRMEAREKYFKEIWLSIPECVEWDRSYENLIKQKPYLEKLVDIKIQEEISQKERLKEINNPNRPRRVDKPSNLEKSELLSNIFAKSTPKRSNPRLKRVK